MIQLDERPRFRIDEAETIAARLFGIEATAASAPSERDQNFILYVHGDPAWVLKIANGRERYDVLAFQNQVLDRLAEAAGDYQFPRPRKSVLGNQIEPWPVGDGRRFFVRLLSFVDGSPWAEARPASVNAWAQLGTLLGWVDSALNGMDDPAAHRVFDWKLEQASEVVRRGISSMPLGNRRAMVEDYLQRYELNVRPLLEELSWGVIHNDANDHNVIVSGQSSSARVVGLLDFGDMVYGPHVYEVAVAAAYAMLGEPDPLAVAAAILEGYRKDVPLSEAAVECLFDLIAMRLCTSVTLAAWRRETGEADDYLLVSERAAWSLLARMAGMEREVVLARLEAARATGPDQLATGPDNTRLLGRRKNHLGPSLSVAYRQPLRIERGYRQFLYDQSGRPYLDCVNNVAHVGHCHPTVVRAGQDQMGMLNTNTRYLHEKLVAYAERLCGTLPEPLSVCYLVCSGSEANELALRLAKTHTGGSEVIVVEGAYHGNTSTLVDVSPYKYDGPGGMGRPAWVHEVPMPDDYRGPWRRGGQDPGRMYAHDVREAADKAGQSGKGLAAFICESILGCGGQIILPDGYLAHAFTAVREAGGVCVADEVQVGFGRVGTHFWAFETQGVVPDIVTMGKPIGNGHPMAAVVTTPEIAASFDNGMEYFNTFGGNPVSCAIGLAVLDVIEDEQLRQNALEVGRYLVSELTRLQRIHTLMGDVRGLGLFVGVELVKDRETLTPAGAEASAVVEAMKDLGVLLSTDGPLHNVLKIKPPLVFQPEDVDYLIAMLDRVLEQL